MILQPLIGPLVFLLFVTQASTEFKKVCGDGWTELDGWCFYFSQSRKNYMEALRECKAFNTPISVHFRLCEWWLFVPHNGSDISVVEEKVKQTYDTGEFILIGIRHIASGLSEAWYWGSGERVGAPWWCNTQPDLNALDEPVLWLQIKQNDLCFHDGGDEHAKYFICEQETEVFCPENYKLNGNRCFGVENIALNFTAAEAECNRLLGGHLAAFHDDDELDFLKRMDANIRPVWIGLTRSGDGSTWMFTDGTIPSTGFTSPNGNDDEDSTDDCVRIDESGDMQIVPCDTLGKYVCMTNALAEVELLHEAWREEYKDLFDMNKDTCLDSEKTRLQVNRPNLDLIIPQVETKANITVYFNQTVDCEQRQVVYLWKDNSNETCTTQRYLKSCDLMTTGNDVTSCSYRCQCEDNQCRVVVVDDEQQFREQPANICEITYELAG